MLGFQFQQQQYRMSASETLKGVGTQRLLQAWVVVVQAGEPGPPGGDGTQGRCAGRMGSPCVAGRCHYWGSVVTRKLHASISSATVAWMDCE